MQPCVFVQGWGWPGSTLLLTQLGAGHSSVHWGGALSRPEACCPVVLTATGRDGTDRVTQTLSRGSCDQHRS